MGISRVVDAVLEATSVSMATSRLITRAMTTFGWPFRKSKLSPNHADNPDAWGKYNYYYKSTWYMFKIW